MVMSELNVGKPVEEYKRDEFRIMGFCHDTWDADEAVASPKKSSIKKHNT